MAVPGATMLTTVVAEPSTTRQVTLKDAAYETLETHFPQMDQSAIVELSFIVTLLTSLYDIREDAASKVVLSMFESTYITSITDTVGVKSIVKIVETRAVSRHGFYLGDPFANLNLVDMQRRGTAARRVWRFWQGPGSFQQPW